MFLVTQILCPRVITLGMILIKCVQTFQCRFVRKDVGMAIRHHNEAFVEEIRSSKNPHDVSVLDFRLRLVRFSAFSRIALVVMNRYYVLTA